MNQFRTALLRFRRGLCPVTKQVCKKRCRVICKRWVGTNTQPGVLAKYTGVANILAALVAEHVRSAETDRPGLQAMLDVSSHAHLLLGVLACAVCWMSVRDR